MANLLGLRGESTYVAAAALTVVVGGMDLLLGSSVAAAARTAEFTPVPGTVTRSELKYGRRGGARLDLEYTYVADGRPRTGTRYRPDPPQSGRGRWQAVHDALPAGAPVTVYYDPDNPDDAVLRPGLSPDLVSLVWFVVPFHIGWLVMVLAAWGEATGRRAFDPALPRCVARTPDGWAARLDGYGPVVTGLGVLGIVWWGSIFPLLVYGVATGDMPPPWVWVAGMVAAVVGSAVAGVRADRNRHLTIDEAAGTITLPGGWWERPRVVVPVAAITAADARERTYRSRSGPYEMRACELRWRDADGTEQTARVGEYYDWADADALTGWLRERISLPAVTPRRTD